MFNVKLLAARFDPRMIIGFVEMLNASNSYDL